MKKINSLQKLIIVVFATFILTGCSELIKVTCPDGRTVFVYRHPEKQFQQYVKTTNVNVKAAIDVLDKIKISGLDASVLNQVTQLRIALDNYSSRFQDIIKASFNAYNRDPCDKELKLSYVNLLDNLNKENSALEKLKIQLASLSDTSKNLESDQKATASLGKQKESSEIDRSEPKSVSKSEPKPEPKPVPGFANQLDSTNKEVISILSTYQKNSTKYLIK